MINSYRDLIVWQRSMELVLVTYAVTERFPKSEIYGLTAQMRRAVISIPSNIAEGKMRGTRKDYRHFLLNAFGSGAELETQIEIAQQLTFVSSEDSTKTIQLLEEVMKMLNVLIQRLSIDEEVR